MARNNVAKQGKAGERPVKSGIHRAAKRIGLEPAEAAVEPLEPIPPGSIEELDVLRNLAALTERIFEHHGEVRHDPTKILREALRSASDDFGVLGDASQGASGAAPAMIFTRAQYRIDLALALFEYRQEFGWVGGANETEVRKQLDAAVAAGRAAGGAS